MSTLVNGTLKITPPSEFNDPFEFAPGIDPNLKVSEKEMRDFLLAPNGFARAVYYLKHPKSSETCYEKWVESAVRRPDLFGQRLQCVREGLTQAISKVYGVICFSAFSEQDFVAPQAVRHWSAYADDHRGLAIEFDGSQSFFGVPAKSKYLFNVRYASKRDYCALGYLGSNSDCALLYNLRAWGALKSEDAWGAEAEWRMIVPLAEKSDCNPRQPIPVIHKIQGERLICLLRIWPNQGSVIRRVILGCRASRELEASVRIALNEPHFRDAKVSLCRAREEPDSFAMRVEPI